jgi:hypothetical protein
MLALAVSAFWAGTGPWGKGKVPAPNKSALAGAGKNARRESENRGETMHWSAASSSKNFTLMLVLVVLAAPAIWGQQTQQASGPHSPDSSAACQSTFTYGSGPSFLQFCVTANGNITEFQSPQGVEHIAVDIVGEGYGICDTNANVGYFDYAEWGDSGNWALPVLTQPKGPNTFPLKIARTTADNVFTLTQNITWNKTERIVQIAMTVKNNTGVTRLLNLLRYADVDANSNINNEFTSDNDSAWGFNHFVLGPPLQYGVMLSATPTSVGHIAYVQTQPYGPDPCNAFANLALTDPFVGDGSVALIYQFSVAPGKTTKLSVEYRRF